MNKIFISIFCLFFISVEAYACASFSGDPKNIKSGAAVKHFFSESEDVRRLLIKNETDEPCKVRLEVLEIIPRIDNAFRYIPFVPNRSLDHSLAPMLSVVDDNGKEILWEVVEIAPKETMIVKINIADNEMPTGTSFASIRGAFPDNPTGLLLTEIYYSKNYETPALELSGLNYDKQTQEVTYTLKGKGHSYTFVQFEIKLIDPVTGFEFSSITNSNGSEDSLKAYIRNFWMPGANDERLIKSTFSLKGFNAIFLKKYNQQFGVDPKNTIKKWVVYIKLRYGIDTAGWKAHHYLSLPPKILEINHDFLFNK